MKKIRRIGFVLLTALAFAACSDDEFQEKVQEGLPVTSLRMQISVPETGNVTMTRASNETETNVEKLALLFYKKSQPDATPVVKEITALGTPEQKSETNYRYTVNIDVDGLYSGEWYLYAVANYDKQFVSVSLDDLKTMTKAQIDDFCTGGSPDLDIVETAILMSGKYEHEAADGTLTLNAGENTLQGDPCLVLRRLISKTIFNFINGNGVTFVPESYDLYNYSTSSTLMERTGWTGSKGTMPGSLGYKANPNTLKNRTDIPITDKNNGNYTFTFYTQENVQPDGTGCSSQADREKYQDNNRGAHPRTNFEYAPKEATYVVVKGRYDGPGKDGQKVTGNVEYTIHLGDFSASSYANFTVRRNVKYTYTVTVKGVDNIIVEATAYNEDQPGAEGNIIQKNEELNVHVDAHYEQILFALDIDANLSSFALSLKTPYTNRTVTRIDDLTDIDDYQWVEFGRPATTSTFESYSTLRKNNKLCNIKELLTKLKDINSEKNQEYFIVNNGKVYVAAYVNEYFYENKNITDFVNAADREMLLSEGTSVSPDGHSSYTTTPIFCIQQRSIKSPMKLSLANPFGIETLEETQRTNSNLNEDTGVPSNSESDGWQNSKKIIGDKANWSTYIDEAYNGYINGVIDSTKVMNSGYDTALYQWLSRNRDNDGDGIIDDDEIRWYLPAHDQCLVIWYGNNSIPTETRINIEGRTDMTYLTSTNGNQRTWWVDEGVAFGPWKNSSWTTDGNTYNQSNNALRAIRNLKDNNGATTSISSYDTLTRTVTITGLADECLRLSGQTGNYPSHVTGDEADKLPRAFKIAIQKIYASQNTYYTAREATTDNTIGSSYSEDNDAGKWRVPNEKELGLMLKYCQNDLDQLTIARTKYGTNRYYYIQTTSGKYISTDNDAVDADGTTRCPIILVRDVEPSASTQATYDSSYRPGGSIIK
ncbi:MAG: DUF4906 domain-containing protein [Phocaeicola plebeius]|nr:DUF4906 domain-containing protein [Phocaeicola plebeius]